MAGGELYTWFLISYTARIKWTSLVFNIGKELFSLCSGNRIHLFMHHNPVYHCLDLMIPYHFHKNVDKLGVFHANQISVCIDPHLN